MPQVQYPFIDIAVHPAVRARFAAGEAIVLFSRDMAEVLWANGEGARLFGHRAIYDLIENGPDRSGVGYRQLGATVAQLASVGDTRGFMMRIASGFSMSAAQAEVSLIAIRGETVVMFSSPVAGNDSRRLNSMLSGFDDAGTHIALLGNDGAVLASSPGYARIGVMPDTARALIAAVGRSADGLVKRPIPSGSGYVPAAIGKLSDELHILFCVETSLGRMDAPDDDEDEVAEVEPPAMVAEAAAAADIVEHEVEAPAVETVDAHEVADQSTFEGDDTNLGENDLPSVAAEDVSEADAVTESNEEGPAAFAKEQAFETNHADTDLGENDLPSAAFEDVSEAEPELESTENHAEELLDAEQAPEVSMHAHETEEGEAEKDIADLAAIDGADEDDIAAHAATETLADADVQAHAGDAEQAFEPDMSADAEDSAETVPDQLTEDVAEMSAEPSDAPEEFVEATAVTEEPQPEENAPDMIDVEEPVQAETSFTFDPKGRPVRFVWKLDALGNFAEVSEEFAKTVGPRSGDVNGQAFRDLAALFDLDPNHEIAGLLERRDTWSGRTIKWPIEGTELVVPVDLAALPTYSRNREFDGFRGFGIIRVHDVEHDPHAFGLTMVDQPASDEDTDEVPLTVDGTFDEPTADEPLSPAQDEFRGEVPALNIVSNPLAAFSDKIIQLEERRAKSTREGLSNSEQAALKEIARQLEPFGKRPNEDVEKSSSGLLQADDISGHDEDDDGFMAETEADNDDRDMDDDGVQTLFEDLGEGPGLTSYALDQIPMAILIHAGDRLIEANSEFRRLTGYATMDALERAGGLDALITRREGPDAGVYLVRADGTQVLVSARLQSARYEGSSALMLALTPAAGTLAAAAEPEIIGESAAARKVAGLKVEVEELRSILETATDGVIILDTEGRIRSMNRSASALFNFDDAETRGKPFAMLFAHESQKAVQDYLAGLAGHGVASVLNDGREVIGREASGGFIPMFMTIGKMPGSNSFCAVIRDITQWKRSEEELKAAKRAAETANQHKSDFLARVSHEIRTPLNAIIGFSDMIASEHFGPAGHARYVEYASDIGRSGRHVLDIVNDLLDISKIEAGEMDLEFAAVGINDCVSEAVSLVQPQANAQRVIIRTSLSQQVPDVVADLRSIKQIALNILANAIRYTPSGGQIVVSTAYEASGSVTLRIRDTGVGMTRSELDQAMKPFGQVASGTRQRGDGTGLGLPLTRAMTEANRASFSIHSAPNEGTLVEISFPPQRVLAD